MIPMAREWPTTVDEVNNHDLFAIRHIISFQFADVFILCFVTIFFSFSDSAPIHRPGLGAQVSHYAPPTRNEHQIQEEMGVPANLVGLIIGRGGENLKRIEHDTGCKVQFAQGMLFSVCSNMEAELNVCGLLVSSY